VRKNTFQDAYSEALQRAHERLLSKDIATCCAGAGAALLLRNGSADAIELDFLNRSVRIGLPDMNFKADADGRPVSIWEQIIILHYLANSERAALQHRIVNYRSLRDGAVYAAAFERRCIAPLLAAFGSTPDSLPAAAAIFGGTPADYGDSSASLPALPHLDIICCLWKGDAEFGPEASILFDAGAEDFLCAEDIAVLCQQIVLALIKNRIS
jgi:hypothetical protein